MLLRQKIWWAVMGLLLCANADARLLLITSQETALYQEFRQGLNLVLAKGAPQEVDVRLAGEVAAVADFAAYSAIVVAGVEAAKALSERGAVNRPVFYTMLPFSSYQWLAENRMLAGQHKVLYIDQPPQRYIQLARAAIPEMRTIGYLHGDTSIVYVDEIRKAAEALKLEFIAANVSADEKLSNLLKDNLADSDAVLLLPDPYLYNRRAVQEVLLASFRYKRPLVVYSESFLKAGALVALFSTPEQIGRHTAELMGCVGQPCYNAIPQRSYPKYFSVLVNEAVARQLGVEIKSAGELQKYLELVEASRLR
jgi:ABC-type uncharacterized transport system substrate-binding protein